MMPLYERLRRIVGRITHATVSDRYRVITRESAGPLRDGWRLPDVAARQQRAFDPVLQRMRDGSPREDFVALADAVRAAGIASPDILEIGCGGGWNSEVLDRLLGTEVRYTGLDYSLDMVRQARRAYPGRDFLVGDAEALPLAAGAFSIVVSGTVLMHLLDYRQAIAETRRVARRYCIFHTVPVASGRPTTILSKHAYGRPVLEVVFNEADLLGEFDGAGLRVSRILDSLPYDLSSVVSTPTRTRTYVCELQ